MTWTLSTISPPKENVSSNYIPTLSITLLLLTLFVVQKFHCRSYAHGDPLNSVMDLLRCRRRCRRNLSTVTAFTFLLFFSAAATTLSPLGSLVQDRQVRETGSGLRPMDRVAPLKGLFGPGSSPPTCRSKCGSCLPCKPVHVPIQPWSSMPLEYYPEAWRCKCGDKLFMP